MNIVSVIMILALLSCQTSKTPDTYVINGEIKGVDLEEFEVELHYAINVLGRPEKMQVSTIRNGKFSFEGNLKHPAFATIVLKVGDSIRYRLNFFNEPSNIALSIDLTEFEPVLLPALNMLDYKVTGSLSTLKYQDYLQKYNASRAGNTIYQRIAETDNSYYDALDSKELDTLKVNKLRSELDRMQIELTSFEKNFKTQYAFKNRESVIGLHALINEFGPRLFDGAFSEAEIDNVLEKLEALKDTPLYKAVIKRNDAINGMVIGKLAPDFALKNSKGEVVSLSSFRGKYVLIDFWTYYCGPCIAKIPHLKEIYRTYKEKGFEIIGVHGDKDADKWLNVLKKHQQPWPQLLDENAFMEDSAVIKYGVQGFPDVFLVDPNGKLIEEHIKHNNLEAILVKYLINNQTE